MKLDINLNHLMSAVDVPAQWVGLREVYEAHTPRMIRDGVPVANGRSATHGIMVEVLVDGQVQNCLVWLAKLVTDLIEGKLCYKENWYI